jgi:dihydrofolate synthase / folylpolyglutamate synthase
MVDSKWPPALQALLEGTSSRIPGKAAMHSRFPPLLKIHADMLPKHCIKIAGTNGKGSVCAMLEPALLADGQSVGLFTSPHLFHVTERIRINGQPISFEEIDEHSRNLSSVIEAFVKSHGTSMMPSFFEVLLLIALRSFHLHKIQVAIFEAGIGGTNDSTSLLPSSMSAITSIGFDHQSILGNSLTAIAQDKVGIASQGSTLVLGPTMMPEVSDTILKQASFNQVTPIITSVNDVEIESHTLDGIQFAVASHEKKSFFLNLSGQHQVENLVVSLKLLEQLHAKGLIKSYYNALDGLKNVHWDCRLMVKKRNPSWILDVAHNSPALVALKKSMDTFIPYSERVLLYGAVHDKDIEACLTQISGLGWEIYLVEGFHRSLSCESIESSLTTGQSALKVKKSYSSPEEAVSSLNQLFVGSGKTIIVAGSLFLSGFVLEILDETPPTV